MDFVNGVEEIIYIKMNGVYLPIGCLTSNSFSENTEVLPTKVRTNKDGWESFVPTSQNYTMGVDGLVTKLSKEVGMVTYYDIQQLKRTRAIIEWKKSGGVDLVQYGEGIITSLSDESSIDSFISFNATIQGQGEPRSNPQIEGGFQYTLQQKL